VPEISVLLQLFAHPQDTQTPKTAPPSTNTTMIDINDYKTFTKATP
jgi:hypothetical protein